MTETFNPLTLLGLRQTSETASDTLDNSQAKSIEDRQPAADPPGRAAGNLPRDSAGEATSTALAVVGDRPAADATRAPVDSALPQVDSAPASLPDREDNAAVRPAPAGRLRSRPHDPVTGRFLGRGVREERPSATLRDPPLVRESGPGEPDVDGDPLGKANAERRRQRDARDQRFLRAVDEIGHMPNSTTLLSKRFGVGEITIRAWCKRLQVDLEVKREAFRAAAKDPDADVDQVPPKALPFLRWSILDLFDRLVPFFDQAAPDEKDDSSPDPAEPENPFSTWTAWRVFLAAAFGLPRHELYRNHDPKGKWAIPDYPGVPTDLEVPRGAAALAPGASVEEIFKGCTGRQTWPEVAAKIVALIVGRRGGKSYITAIIGIFLACCRSYRLKLGTKGMVMILARDKEQAGVIRGYVLAFLKAVPFLSDLLVDEPTQKLIELANGITIEIRAVGEAGTRGYTVVAALADEIAFWPTDAESAKQDRKVVRALRPAMFGIKGAMLVMLSSPYARRGELYEAHRKGYGDETQGRYFVWQADTLSMRPTTDPEMLGEIIEEYEDDPENAKAEYGAQFRSDLENIYSRQAIEAVSVPGRFEQGYRDEHYPYRAFVDPSGGSSDSYVLAVAHDEKRTTPGGETITIPVLDRVKEWQPKFDPEQVSVEAVEILRGFKISKVTGDAYGGEWPRDPLKKRGIEYELSEQTRSELYLSFLPIVNSGRCELLDPIEHKRAVNQFSNLERRAGRTGKDSVNHLKGHHDDVANAIAGVMVQKGAGLAELGAVW